MTLFKNRTAQEVWLLHWCERCYRNRNGVIDCDILRRALGRDRKPPQWDRNPRAQTMAEAYRCDEFATRPPRRVKRQLFEDVSMFDDDEIPQGEIEFVPVEGWPDDPKWKDTDHA